MAVGMARVDRILRGRPLAAPLAATLAISAWMLFGCASSTKVQTGDPSLPEIDVLQLKENSDEALKLSQENKLEIQSLGAKLTELESRISALGDEISNLPVSKLEELGQQVSLVSEQLRNLEDRMGKPAAPGAKKGLQTFAPNGLAEASGTKTAGDSAAASAPAGGAPGGGKAPAPVKPSPHKPSATDAEAQLYKKAFDLYYAKDYDQAIQKFNELVGKYPAGTYSDNCHYWIGECQFALGNLAKAITSFRKVFAFPQTEKADDAQLKLGYCYLRLGERKQAAEEFKKVVSLYPDSEYTERAKEELAKLE